MASQPLVRQGVVIPPDEIHAILRSAAIPGFTGTVYIELGIREEAAQHVQLTVIRRESHRTDARTTTEVIPSVGDTERKKCVQRVIEAVRGKLYLRPVITAIEAWYDNGELKKWNQVE